MSKKVRDFQKFPSKENNVKIFRHFLTNTSSLCQEVYTKRERGQIFKDFPLLVGCFQTWLHQK